MLVEEAIVASELSTADAKLDEYSSKEVSSDVSEGSCCQSCSDSDCSTGCSCGYQSESGENEASEIEDDYTETFKSLSLKGKSVTNTPVKEKSPEKANIPKKESPCQKTLCESKAKKGNTDSKSSEPAIEAKVVKSSGECNEKKCCPSKVACPSKVKCCKKTTCPTERPEYSDDECCSTPKNVTDEKAPQATAPAGRSCCIM